jgi:Tfp pilus assembly protein PilO
MDKFSFTDQYQKYYRTLEPVLAKPKTKKYSTVIFFFLVVSLFGWYAIRPTIQTILYLRKEVADKIVVNQKMDDKINALITAQSLYESVSPRLTLLTDAIPENPHAVEIMKQLQQLSPPTQASLSGAQISTVPIVQTRKENESAKKTSVTYSDFPISVTLSGPYTSLSHYLSQLIAMRRIVKIQSISYAPARESASASATPFVQLVLQLNTYYELP